MPSPSAPTASAAEALEELRVRHADDPGGIDSGFGQLVELGLVVDARLLGEVLEQAGVP